MERREYHTKDKSAWIDGPWKQEPDKIQWEDFQTGLPCLIVRNDIGALCGYVGVPNDHPWHGKEYGEIDAVAHGGLTFTGPCMDVEDESRGVCHVPGEGEPDDVWWVGFDCAHWNDKCDMGIAHLPELKDLELFGRSSPSAYRDVDYVTKQVRRLAAQADAAALRPTAKAESV
jgi:hypothetical protein